jgi:hypothetical protein
LYVPFFDINLLKQSFSVLFIVAFGSSYQGDLDNQNFFDQGILHQSIDMTMEPLFNKKIPVGFVNYRTLNVRQMLMRLDCFICLYTTFFIAI